MSTPTNRKFASELATVLAAYVDGHTVQFRSRGTNAMWLDVVEPTVFRAEFEYRIKPEPRYRPWKWNEVPLGAKCRSRIGKHDICTILATSGKGVFMCPTGHESQNFAFQMDAAYVFDHLLAYREWFNESSSTWETCGVSEE